MDRPRRAGARSVYDPRALRRRYACYQESAQNASGAYVNQYAGEAQSGVVHSRSAYLACIGAHGYVVSPNGDLVAPPGMEIFFQRP